MRRSKRSIRAPEAATRGMFGIQRTTPMTKARKKMVVKGLGHAHRLAAATAKLDALLRGETVPDARNIASGPAACEDGINVGPPAAPKRARAELTDSHTEGGEPSVKKPKTRADGPASVPVFREGGEKQLANQTKETKTSAKDAQAPQKRARLAEYSTDRPANNPEKLVVRRQRMAPKPQEVPIDNRRRATTETRSANPPIVPAAAVITAHVHSSSSPNADKGTMYSVDGTASPIGAVVPGSANPASI
ncbi:hypothetical protein R3P38DRAFT_476712 [Favolaschia claudopus]|uniref:Uncharacterized protein n=1 Tax=Favolaschia claudopus TaxID=2862362 RepID=A0AAW0CJN5_9AGAR